jgi:hypothetical protein
MQVQLSMRGVSSGSKHIGGKGALITFLSSPAIKQALGEGN